jgi:hypothetical protein
MLHENTYTVQDNDGALSVALSVTLKNAKYQGTATFKLPMSGT